MLRFFVFLFLAPLCVHGAPTVQNLIQSAEAQNSYGDFYQSYRSYLFLQSQKPAQFYANVEGYLHSLFIIGDKATVRDECQRIVDSKDNKYASKAAYICGLKFLELRRVEEAEKFLALVSEKSNFYLPGLILKATLDLLKDEPAAALAKLPTTLQERFAKLGFEDLFNLTRARSFAAQNKFEESVKGYQTIGIGSPYYTLAIEETSWVFFKQRKFESARVLMDVIGAHYFKTSDTVAFDVSPSQYFRIRYLKAYMSLIEQQQELAQSEFVDLKKEYEKYVLEQKPKVVSNAELISKSIAQWQDVKSMPIEVREQLDLVNEWSAPELKRELEIDILFQLAIRKELNRTQKFRTLFAGEVADYPNQIRTISDRSWIGFSKKYDTLVKSLGKALNALTLKSEMGRLEIAWMGRAQGARTVDEIIENYSQEVRSIDELLE